MSKESIDDNGGGIELENVILRNIQPIKSQMNIQPNERGIT
jgi:hypothetical protein